MDFGNIMHLLNIESKSKNCIVSLCGADSIWLNWLLQLLIKCSLSVILAQAGLNMPQTG